LHLPGIFLAGIFQLPPTDSWGKKLPTPPKYFIGKVCAKWLLKKAWEQNQIQIKDKQIGR